MNANALLSRIKALEEKQKPSISDLKKNIVQYALRPLNDFDKYKAMDLIEQLKNVAVQIKDKKADYYITVYATLMEQLVKPAEHFRNYILSLLGDTDYKKVIEAVSKIDKAIEKDLTPSSFSNSVVSPSFVPPYYNPLPPRKFSSSLRFSFPQFTPYSTPVIDTLGDFVPVIITRGSEGEALLDFVLFVTDGATLRGTAMQKEKMIVKSLIMVLNKNNFTLLFEL